MTPGREREIPPPKGDPGMGATDDHVAATAPGGGHQPTADLDRGVGDEHLRSPSQGVRREKSPAGTDEWAGGGIATGSSDFVDDEGAGGGPDAEEDGGDGPAYESDR